MSYQIALTQVSFNNSYENVMRFELREEQERFFELERLFLNAPTLNLLAGDFFTLEIPYKVQGISLQRMESYNYCILKEVNDNGSRYYYYFITNLRYDSSNQFILSLEMDIFNTYYIDAGFSPALINRAHLNRFELVLDDQDNPVGVKFDNKPNSLMLIPDMNTELSKYCYDRKPLRKYYTSNTDINNWLNENVECWLYIYLQLARDQNGIHKYRFYDGGTATTDYELPKALFSDESAWAQTSSNTQYFDNYYTYICMPIYKTGKRLYIRERIGSTNYDFEVDADAEEHFRAMNGDTSYYIARCISQVPPKNVRIFQSSEYVIENGNLYLKADYSSNAYPMQALGSSVMAGHVVTSINDDKKFAVLTPFYVHLTDTNSNILVNTATTYSADLGSNNTIYQNQFPFSAFENANFNRAFNPKLYGSIYRSLKIANNDGARFEYDMQKMNNGQLKLLYTEKPQPNVTRTYTRLNTFNNDYGVYMRPTAENLTGLVVSQDCNLSYSKDQLASYLAQNRNAQTQLTARGIQGLTKAITNTIGDVAIGAVAKGTKGATAGGMGVVGFVNAGIDMGFNQLNFELSKDNMAYAPDEIKNANGDVIFNMCCTEFNVFVERYTALDCELDREAERMNLFGFKYNRLGYIKDVDNIRKYFNYVQAVVESGMFYDYKGVPRPLPPKVLNRFKDAFAKGVRFWNYSGGKFLDYTKENYENWLIPYVEGI